MTSLPLRNDCWNRIGVHGDHSCPELAKVVHCHNCPVFSQAGRRFLDAPSPEGYLAEWTQRLASAPEETATDLQSVLVFRLAEEWLALPVQVLVEVTATRPIHRIPYHGGLLAGLVNIRGELQLCAHLAQLLGITPAAAASGRERFLVVDRETEHWVFPVDEVDQVYRFPKAELTRVPPTVARAGSHLTSGVFAWRDRSIGYLDAPRLFEALRTRTR